MTNKALSPCVVQLISVNPLPEMDNFTSFKSNKVLVCLRYC